jgi:hypothetical protein
MSVGYTIFKAIFGSVLPAENAHPEFQGVATGAI